MESSGFKENKKYITAKEASVKTGYSQDYIGQMARSGKVDSKKVGRVWYVEERSLLGLDAKKYIPAKEASSRTGYSQDYIGQLARSGKIDSKKVGRVWYVGEESILNYNNLPEEISGPTRNAGSIAPAGEEVKVKDILVERTPTHKVFDPKSFLKTHEVLSLVTSLALTISMFSISGVDLPSVFKNISTLPKDLLTADVSRIVGEGISVVDSAAENYKSYLGLSGEKRVPLGDALSLFKKYVTKKTTAVEEKPKTLTMTRDISPTSLLSALRNLLEVGLPEDLKVKLTGPAGPEGREGPQGPVGPINYTFSTPTPSLPNPNGPIGVIGGFASLGVQELNTETLVASSNITQAGGTTSLQGTTVNGALSVTGNTTLLGTLSATGTITGTFSGAVNPNFTLGSVVFQGGSGLAQDNANFFWDDVNNRLGLGTVSPSGVLDIRQGVNGVTGIYGRRATDVAPSGDFISYYNAAGNTALFRVDNSGNIFAGGISNSGALTITSTSTPQFRVQYDASNESTTSVSSAGISTFGFNGSTPKAIFVPQSNATDTFQFQNASAVPVLTINTSVPNVTVGGTLTSGLINSQTISSAANFTGTVAVATSVSVPSIITASGPLTITPVAGSNLNVNLSTTGDFAVNTNQLYVDTSAGNVGIGTTAPQALFHASGTIKAGLSSSNSEGAIILGDGARTDNYVGIFRSNLISGGSNAYLSLGGYDGIIFNASNAVLGSQTERMRIDSTGNVGIGTTAPLLKLDVAGSGRFTGAATSVLTGSIDPIASATVTGVGTLFTTQLVIGDRITVTGETRTVIAIASDTSLTVDTAFTDNANDTSPDKLPAIFIARDSANALKVVINDLGNVGIGVTAPATMLELKHATSDTAIRISTVTDGQARLEFAEVGSTGWSIGERGADDKFYISNSLGGLLTTPRLTIDTSGNVGIGTTNFPIGLFKTIISNGGGATATSIGATTELVRFVGGDTNNDYLMLGFHDLDSTSETFSPVQIGYQLIDTTASGKGDFLIATRNVTSNDAPTERMRISAAGIATFSGALNVGGDFLTSNAATNTYVQVNNTGANIPHFYISRQGGTVANFDMYLPSGSTDMRMSTSVGADKFIFSAAGTLTSVIELSGYFESTGNVFSRLHFPTIGGNVGVALSASLGGSLKNIIQGAYNEDTTLAPTRDDGNFLGDVVIRQGGAERVRVTETGVGIGTITPTANLQVTQGTAGVGTVTTNGTTTLVGSGTQFLNTFRVGDTITVSGETVRTIATITDNTNLTSTVAFSTSASGLSYTLTGGTRFSVLGNGNVGIGTTGPDNLLHLESITGNSIDLLKFETAANNVGEYIGAIFNTSAHGAYGGIRVYNGDSANDSSISLLTSTDGSTLTRGLTQDHLGNVGIGTTAPIGVLQVNGDLDVGDTNSGRVILHHSGTPSTDRVALSFVTAADRLDIGTSNFNEIHLSPQEEIGLFVDRVGAGDVRVGIGKTDPGKLVHLSMNDSTVSTTDLHSFNGLKISNTNTTANTGTALLLESSVTGGAVSGIVARGTSADRSNLEFFTEGADGRVSRTVITSDGNVGIGTTAPGGKLEIKGGVVTTTPALSLSDAEVGHPLTGWTPATNYGFLNILHDTAGGLQIFGASDAAGNGGIDIEGFIGSTNPTDTVPAVWINGGKSDGGTGQAALGALETVLQIANGGTAAVTLLGSGNVGIGITNPGNLLTVQGATATGTVKIYNTTGTVTDAQAILEVRSDDTTDPGAHDLLNLNNGGTVRMLVQADGSVGIGTTTPSALLGTLLDVAGNIRLGGKTDDTNKINYGITAEQYDSGTEVEGWRVIHARSDSTTNSLKFGGSTSTENAATDITFWTAANVTTLTGTERMIINSSGNIGIDVTSPAARLSISLDDTTVDRAVNLAVSGAKTVNTYGQVIANSATNTTTDAINKIGLYIDSTGTFTGLGGTATNNYGLYIDTISGADNNYGAYISGNVGIGTTGPSNDLTFGGASPVISTDTSDASDNKYLKLGGGGAESSSRGAVIVLGGNEEATWLGNLILNPGDPAAAQVKIDDTVYVGAGLVGIGVIAPDDKLDIRDGKLILSDAGVGHGMTDFGIETTAYSFSSQLSGADEGGLYMGGLSDAAGAGGLFLFGTIGNSDPTDTVPAVRFNASKKHASNPTDQALAAAETAFQFGNYTTILATILGDGKVGIGTTSPQKKLHVASSAGTANTLQITNNDTGATATDGVEIGVFSDEGASVWNFENTYLSFATNNTERARFDAGGTFKFSSAITDNNTGQYLCIDTTTFEVKRNNTACSASSQRFKENIVNMNYGLAEVLALRPVSFTFKPEMNFGTDPQLGFIAEEVAQIFPELVSYDSEGLVNSVNYPILTAVLTKAIQELDLKINTIDSRVSALEALGHSLTGEANALNAGSGIETLGQYAVEFFSAGVQSIVDGVVYMKNLAVETLKVGSSQKRVGITLFDEVTGDPYCVSIANGTQKIVSGSCIVVDITNTSSSPAPVPEEIVEPTPEEPALELIPEEPTPENEQPLLEEELVVPEEGPVPEITPETETATEEIPIG